MSYSSVKLDVADCTAVITISRPSTLNDLSSANMFGLDMALG